MGSLQTRITVAFLALMLSLQAGIFAVIHTAGSASVRKNADDELVAGGRMLERLMEQDTLRLAQGVRVLSSDDALREAMLTGDAEKLNAVLSNPARRIEADLMIVIGVDQRVMADTSGAPTDGPFPFPMLLGEAQTAQQAVAMVSLHGRLYQLVIAPVVAPLPTGWIGVGSVVNDALAYDLHRLTRLQVSFLTRERDLPWRLQASTLSGDSRDTLLRDFLSDRFGNQDAAGNSFSGDDDGARVLSLPERAGEPVVAILQRSLAPATEPFHRLERKLALIALLAIGVSVIAGATIAHGIVRPVSDLARVARHVAAGKYMSFSSPRRSDEIGDLAAAFRTMQAALAAREARITDLAYRDTLTGLSSSTHLTARLDEVLRASAHVRTPVAIAIVELDQFQQVEDTLGRPVAEALLRGVSARLQPLAEKPGDMVARWSGERFAILLPGFGAADAPRIADAISSRLEAPLRAEGSIVEARSVIGIAAYPDQGEDSATLLRRADAARSAAKRGNVCWSLWDESFDKHIHERITRVSELRTAIESDEFTLVYQPVVSLRGDVERRVEALLRWQHPVRGLLGPSEFIPVAEQTGYTRTITQWALACAVMRCAAWRAEGLPICISVDVRAGDLMDAELPERVASLLRQHRCAAAWIALEIPEGAIREDPPRSIENLKRIHALGCRIVVDDYGTGCSPLAYLSRAPVHELKIDAAFVAAMGSDARGALIVGSTIDLAHNMGLSVVAHGVDDEATMERLRAMDCDRVQGAMTGGTLTAAEVPRWLRGSVSHKTEGETRALRRVV